MAKVIWMGLAILALMIAIYISTEFQLLQIEGGLVTLPTLDRIKQKIER